jgi:hypothetical protein
VVEERFYAAAGRPATDPKTGAHRWEATYEGKGKRSTIAYFDVEGKPVAPKKGAEDE